jgi:hypothetical protein
MKLKLVQVHRNRVDYFIAKFHLLGTICVGDMNFFPNCQCRLRPRASNFKNFSRENYPTEKFQNLSEILTHTGQHW